MKDTLILLVGGAFLGSLVTWLLMRIPGELPDKCPRCGRQHLSSNCPVEDPE